MKQIIVSVIMTVTMLTGMIYALPQQASAAVDPNCANSMFLGLPAWYKYLDVGAEGGDECAIKGPKNESGDLDMRAVASRVGLAVIEIMLRLATFAAIAFVLYGGFRYITSQGEPDNAKQARQTILNALIGLVISLLAAAIVAFIANRLTR